MTKTLSLVSVLILAFAWSGCSDDDNSNCKDLDGDGVKAGSDCPAGDAQDCDDDDSTVWQEMTGYADADGDGEAVATESTLCTDGTLPSGYLDTAGADCDDTDADLYQELDGYVDADGDGYGDATGMQSVCSGADLPDGFADNDTDCNDASDMVYTIVDTYYPDYDGDGVFAATPMEACTDGTKPDGWSATAGTDCDDHDVFVQSSATDPMGLCEVKGQCLDIEMIHPAIHTPDGYGVGACPMGLDCNDASPLCNAPTIPVNPSVSCTDDSDCDTGDLCLNDDEGNPVCHSVPACCNNSTGASALHCSELSNTIGTGCLQACVLPDDPSNQEVMAYATCLSTCIGNATPKAQHLYGQLQSCLATAGCMVLGGQDLIDCATTNCAAFSMACLGDVP